jgi:hypothetical protein
MGNVISVLGKSEVELFACAVIDKENTVLLIKNLYDNTLYVVLSVYRKLRAEAVSGEVRKKRICRGSYLRGEPSLSHSTSRFAST